jgi:hypothetical protein
MYIRKKQRERVSTQWFNYFFIYSLKMKKIVQLGYIFLLVNGRNRIILRNKRLKMLLKVKKNKVEYDKYKNINP